MDCFICRKHRGDVTVPGGSVYEDDWFYVGHRGYPNDYGYLGYFMVDLKRHAPGIGDLSESESAALGTVLKKVACGLSCELGAEHVYLYVHGDAVPHFHVHLIPRYAGTPDRYRDPVKIVQWSGAPSGGKKDIESVCDRMRVFLAAPA